MAGARASQTIGVVPAPIRIAIGQLPRLLSEIVEELVDADPGLCLVPRGGELDALAGRADVLVTDASPDAPLAEALENADVEVRIA